MASIGLPSLGIFLLVILSVFTVSTFASSSQDEETIVVQEPVSRSYFDELSRFSKYTSRIKEAVGKDDDISYHSLDPWQDILKAFGIFQQVQMRAHSKPPDIFSLLTEIEKLALAELAKVSPPSPCVNDTATLIIGLVSREPWALQFLDAAGKPGPSLTKFWWNFVGNYDQCKEAVHSNKEGSGNKFNGGYFTLPISIVNVPFLIKFGFCLPDTCSVEQVTVLFQALVRDVPNVFVGKTTESKVVTSVTAATIVAIMILLSSGIMAVIGTLYDLIYIQKKIQLASKRSDLNGANMADSDGLPTYGSAVTIAQNSNPNDEAQPLIQRNVVIDALPNPSTGGKILLAFSLYTNGKKLLNTSQSEGSLGSIHGIRFLSMTWVVLGHTYLFGTLNNTLNFPTELQTLVHRWTFDAVVNALVSVDTFFTLSGLLTSYLTVQALWKHGLNINWPKVYFHRFWRLTPPYMFTLVIVLGLQQYLGHGPMWTTEQPADKKFCEDNWWTNLLYVNNLVKPKEMCFGHSWYLANDMQFFVVSPLMMVPFYFHWAAGLVSCLYVLLASWIATGVLAYHNDWSVTIFDAMTKPNSTWFNKYYIVPWCRIGPYVIGILAGYLLARYKRRPFRMRSWVVALGWVLAITSALGVLYGVHGDISGEDVSSRSAAAFYNTVSRSVWGASVCWVVVACAAGYGGPINALLSWSPFVVLGRLTYMTYLIHLSIINVYFGGMGALFFFNDNTMPIIFLGLLMFSNMVAFAAVLLFESPMIGLEKALLHKKRQD